MATEEREALAPCPFCGGAVQLEHTVDRRDWWGVVCRNAENVGGTCAIQQRPSASKEAATARWNRRVPDPAQSATISRLTAEVGRIREALTASGDTKAAYMGEFHFDEERVDEDGVPYNRRTTVPWTTVKEIMAAILARALANTAEEGRDHG